MLTEAGKKKRAGVWLLTPEAARGGARAPRPGGARARRRSGSARSCARERAGSTRSSATSARSPASAARRRTRSSARAKLSPFALLDRSRRRGGRAARDGDRRRARARPRAARARANDDADVYRVHRQLRRAVPRLRARPLARVDFEEHTIYYCPTCQTGGRSLKDRRLSRLLALSCPARCYVLRDDRPAASRRRHAGVRAAGRLALSRAGVTGRPARRSGSAAARSEKLIAAEIDCTVDLDPDQKGVHMSRFPELFEEAIERGRDRRGAARRGARRAHRARTSSSARARCAPRCGSLRAIRCGATTPVTGLPTQEMVSLIGIAAATARRRAPRRRRRGDRDQRLPVRAGPRRAAARPSGSPRRASTASDVERILELVPLATHNQRGRGTLYVGTERERRRRAARRDRRALDERAVYELLKRPDELFVVEHAHLQPRFVEDSVRVALKGAARRVPGARGRRLRLLAPGQPRDDPRRTTSLAERYGTVGELRAELDGGARGRRQTTLADWLTG